LYVVDEFFEELDPRRASAASATAAAAIAPPEATNKRTFSEAFTEETEREDSARSNKRTKATEEADETPTTAAEPNESPPTPAIAVKDPNINTIESYGLNYFTRALEDTHLMSVMQVMTTIHGKFFDGSIVEDQHTTKVRCNIAITIDLTDKGATYHRRSWLRLSEKC